MTGGARFDRVLRRSLSGDKDSAELLVEEDRKREDPQKQRSQGGSLTRRILEKDG